MKSKEDCKWCARKGLQILPLRIAYVPDGLDNLPPAITNGNAAPPTPLASGKYMLRTITSGYVYTYDARHDGVWRCFAADPKGRFREYLVNQPPDQQPEFSCQIHGDNLDASLVNVEQANEATDVWVGYSPVWLTPDALRDLRNNATLWAALMVKLKPAGLVNGSAPPSNVGWRLNDVESLSNHVLEYADGELAGRLYATTLEAAVDQSGLAADLVERAKQISPLGAVAIALNDPIGQAADAAAWRNILAGKLADFRATKAKARPQMVREIINGLKKGMEKDGHADQWAERYAPKLDMTKLKKDQDDYDAKVKALVDPISHASDDWLTLVDRDLFTCEVWKLYDGVTSKDVGLAMESHLAACVDGVGARDRERKWWVKWVTAKPGNDAHPLWTALAAGDAKVVDYIKAKAGDGVSVFGHARESYEELKKWLAERHADQRAAQPASRILGYALAAYLPRLAKEAPQEARVIGARLRMVYAVRTDVVFQPFSTRISIQDLVVMLYETVWGPPEAGMTREMAGARRMLIRQSVRGSLEGNHLSTTRMVELDMWLPDSAFGEGTEAKAALGAPAAPKLLNRGPLNPYAAMNDYLKSADAKLAGLGGALALVNLAGAIGSVVEALGSKGPDADAKLNESIYNVISGVLGVSAVVGEVTGSIIQRQIAAGIEKKAATTLAKRMLGWRLAGGVFATFAAWTDAVQYFGTTIEKFSAGDKDAAWAYGGAATMAALSGVASAALVLISVHGAAAAGTGTVAALAASGGTLAGAGASIGWIPIVGWTIVLVGAIAATVYFLVKAKEKTDTPLEVWLSRCYYHNTDYDKKRDPYTSYSEEMGALNDALYGLQITIDWQSEIGRDRLILHVLMPNYSHASDYAYKIVLRGNKGEQVLATHASGLSSDPELKPHEKDMPTISAAPEKTWGEKLLDKAEDFFPVGSGGHAVVEKIKSSRNPVEIQSDPVDATINPGNSAVKLQRGDGYAVLSMEVLVNEDWYDRCGLKFTYWPDPIHHPRLEMKPVGYEKTYRLEKKHGVMSWIF